MSGLLRGWRAAVGLLFLFVVSACGTGGADGEDERPGRERAILVLGASDLLAAFEELVPRYEARTGDRVDVVLGSTGNLAAQIRHGAPADLFFSADEGFLDDLIDAGRIDPATRSVYAVGRIAVVTPPGTTPPEDPAGLRESRFRTLAIANPEHAPYGRAAREALRTVGAWEDIQTRLVLGENVAHALQFVRTGNADAGIVALSLVEGGFGQAVPYRLVDDALHPPILQVAGVTTGSRQPEAARAFLEFVLSHEGRGILAEYGFERPPRGEDGAWGAAVPTHPAMAEGR